MPFPALTIASDDDNLLGDVLALIAKMQTDPKGNPAKIVGWCYRGPNIVLYRHKPSKPAPDEFIPFPAPMPANVIRLVVQEQLQMATYPREPGHDGTNKKGWRITSRVPRLENGPDVWEAFCMIEPVWMEYGK